MAHADSPVTGLNQQIAPNTFLGLQEPLHSCLVDSFTDCNACAGDGSATGSSSLLEYLLPGCFSKQRIRLPLTSVSLNCAEGPLGII